MLNTNGCPNKNKWMFSYFGYSNKVIKRVYCQFLTNHYFLGDIPVGFVPSVSVLASFAYHPKKILLIVFLFNDLWV